MLVGFIRLRLASGPDLKSRSGAEASAGGAEDALALLLFDEVFSISPRTTAPLSRLPARLWARPQCRSRSLCKSQENRPMSYRPWIQALHLSHYPQSVGPEYRAGRFEDVLHERQFE